MEFSLQFGCERGWIPLTLTLRSDRTGRNRIRIGTDDATTGNVLIRDYFPELKMATLGSNTVTVCDFKDSVDSVQFRWLQTCEFDTRVAVRDEWTLDSVLITYQDGKNGSIVLFEGSKYVRVQNFHFPINTTFSMYAAVLAGLLATSGMVLSLQERVFWCLVSTVCRIVVLWL